MQRPASISYKLLFDCDPGNLKKWLLLYDQLWVPALDKNLIGNADFVWESDEERTKFSDLQWLAAKGEIIESPVGIFSDAYAVDPVIESLRNWLLTERDVRKKTFRTATAAAKAVGASIFNMDIGMSRLISYISWRDKNEVVFPVLFPFLAREKQEKIISQRQPVLSLILQKFPDPSMNVPLADIVGFKQDAATKEKYDRIWNWIRNISKEQRSPFELKEEIDWLLTDYTSHLKHLTKKVTHNKLKIIISGFADMAGNFLKLNWGKLTNNVMDIRGENIEANEAEMKLPGSEIAYLKDSIELLSGKK